MMYDEEVCDCGECGECRDNLREQAGEARMAYRLTLCNRLTSNETGIVTVTVRRIRLRLTVTKPVSLGG